MATKRRSYYKGIGEHVAGWAEDNLRQTKGRWAGVPLDLEPWQRDILDELYLVDEDGKFIYREALLGLPRKNGKSTLVAAICLYGLLASGEQGAEVYAAAASRDQARIVFNQAREFVEASPELRQALKPMRNVITCPSNNGVFRVLSSDAPLQHGLNPSLVAIDELWAHKDRELYYALTTGQLARENPLVVDITTAGWDRSSICWEVYQHGRALKDTAAQREAQFMFRWFQGDEGCDHRDPKQWAKANPASWITDELLEREADRLPEFVFRRLHLNQWTDIEDAWISAADWDACAGEPQVDPDRPAFMGVDIGLRRDARAIVWAQWGSDDEDAKLHIGQEITVPDPDHPLSSTDARARVKENAAKLSALREVAFDPWAFSESAEMLEDEGLPMVQYDQTNINMAPASERLYELIKDHRLVHDGDETLRAQILAAVAAETERGWRISKRKSKERIDGAIALLMAVDRAVQSRGDDPDAGVVYIY